MLEAIKTRLAADKAEYTDGQYDQSIRDREYLIGLIEGATK